MANIIIGSDHGGFNLKQYVIEHLKNKGLNVVDLGCYNSDSCDYPVIAKAVSEKVLEESSRGILICGTGIGVSIVANRYDGIRASHCTDTFTARMTRMHNDSNVLAIGADYMDTNKAIRIVRTWIATEFEGGRHEERLKMIEEIEIENMK